MKNLDTKIDPTAWIELIKNFNDSISVFSKAASAVFEFNKISTETNKLIDEATKAWKKTKKNR